MPQASASPAPRGQPAAQPSESPRLARTPARIGRPPRLLLRFGAYTAICLGLAAAGILLFIRHNGIEQAEKTVLFHADFVADSLLEEELRASDFEGTLPSPRRIELDELFARRVLVGGTLRVRLYGADGRPTYASDGSLDPSAGPPPAAFEGAAVTETALLPVGPDGDQAKVLEAYVPVRRGTDATTGVFAISQDYAPIAAAARKAFLPVAFVLQLVLLTLYVLLFPILRRVTENLRSHTEEIRHQALHDDLTGLPNRTYFRERVEQALAAAKQESVGVGIVLLDLDRFKEINDTLGHESGDLLLKALALRLRETMRASDTVARLGGDEFGLLSPAAIDAGSAMALAERVRRTLEEPFMLNGLMLQVEASAGIALAPDHGDDVETLVRHADVALYRSKQLHAPQLYASDHDHYSPARLTLVGELRQAIANGELVLHYQPRADLRTGRIGSVEALLRWHHPRHGVLPPAEFIPLAEHTGLIRPLTRYVIAKALEECREWRAGGIDLGVAVNLSARDLLDLSLPEEVSDLLEASALDAGQLELEITESTLLTDPARARAVLMRLSERGVGLAIDDFGSGYSSLSYLRGLPVDVLKIDKSFVLNMDGDENDAVIVRSTIDLGHNLGLAVVAEGVETQATWDRLAELACDTAQGFLVSRPVPAATLVSWLLRRAGGHNGKPGLPSPRAATA